MLCDSVHCNSESVVCACTVHVRDFCVSFRSVCERGKCGSTLQEVTNGLSFAVAASSLELWPL